MPYGVCNLVEMIHDVAVFSSAFCCSGIVFMLIGKHKHDLIMKNKGENIAILGLLCFLLDMTLLTLIYIYIPF